MHKLTISLILLFYALPLQAGVDVVARVNGVAISARQLEIAESRLITTSTFHGDVSDEKRREFQERALQGLIIGELQYQDALARGFQADKNRVKAQIMAVKNRFSSEKEFKKALSEAGVTEDDIRSRVEKNLVVEDAVKKIVADASRWNDADLKAYYDSNPAKFKQPESVRLRIISIASEKKATKALELIHAGEAFGTVAAKMSEDNYRTVGGDIGYLHRGRIYPELENEAFRMKPGDVSGLVRAEGMWFIVKVEEKKTERQITFEEAKDKLKKELEANRSAELLGKWIQELSTKAKIEILINSERATDVRGGRIN